MRNDVESGNHAHESGTYRRYVGKDQRDHQHAGSIFSKARDGWCDKSDHDQRNTEGDQLTEQLLCRNNNVHKSFVCNQSDQNTDDHTGQQTERKTVE